MTSCHEIRQLAVGQFGQMGCHGLNCDAYVFIAWGDFAMVHVRHARTRFVTSLLDYLLSALIRPRLGSHANCNDCVALETILIELSRHASLRLVTFGAPKD